jgi:hypothetical protein
MTAEAVVQNVPTEQSMTPAGLPQRFRSFENFFGRSALFRRIEYTST